MLTVIIRLITLRAENVIPEVIWGMVIVYLVAMLLTLTSVWVCSRSASNRLFWSLVVMLIPFIGILAHCLRCLAQADLEALKQLGLFQRSNA